MAAQDPEARARPLGYYSGVSALAPALGVILGGPLVEVVGWRLIFATQALIAAITFLAARSVLPETPRRSGIRFDVAGATALGVGISGLVFAANRGAAWGFDHIAVIVAAALAPIGIATFVAVERRVTDPFLPLEMFRRPAFGASLGAQALMQGSFMGSLIVTPLLIERFWGYGAWLTSVLVLPRPLGFSAAAWWAGRRHAEVGGQRLVAIGLAVLTTGNVLTAVGAGTTSLAVIIVGAGLSGFGNGGTRPSLTAAVGNSAA